MSDYTLSAKITGDASGFEKAAKGAQSTLSTMQSKFSSIGNKLSGLGKTISGLGDTLTNKLTKPALAATTALAGITIAKGFSRLTGIDDAQAKLKGLGHDAESVTEIMNSALASVKGTSYGLDEAATTAASAVAAGIKPGQDLTRYLSITADAAAIAGASMSDMGSIINKVQTSQVAYTDSLNQLSDRGLPIYQWLAEEAGVAASEVKELASEGKISSEMFLAAIEKNIGGAAKTIGEESFTAAIANIWASVGRIGANFLDAGGQAGGFFSSVKPLLTEFNNMLGTVEDKATELGQKFGDAFNNIVDKIRDLKASFDGLDESTQQTIIKAVGIGAAIIVGIGPALKIIGSLTSVAGKLSKVMGFIASPVGIVVAAIAALAAGVVYLMNTNEDFRNKVLSVWDSVKSTISTVIETIQPILSNIFTGVVEGFKGLLPTFQTIFSTVVDLVGTLVEAFQGFFGGLLEGFSGGLGGADGFQTGIMAVLGAISPPLKIIITLFKNFAPQIKNLVSVIGSSLVPIFETLGTTIGEIAAAVMPAIQSAISNLIPVIGEIIDTVTTIIATVLPVVVSLISQLLPVITQIVAVIGQVVAALAPMIAQLISTLLPVISNIITVIMDIVTSAMPAIMSVIGAVMSIIETVAPVIMNILAVVIDVVSEIITAISPIVSFVGDIITSIIEKITPIIEFIAGVISTVISAIASVIDPASETFATIYSVVSEVFDNISSFISGVIDTVGGVISSITEVVGPVFDGIYTTVSTVMEKVGSFISGIFDGIETAWNGLTDFVGGVFDGIASTVSTLVDTVKGFVNGVIGGINSAIGLINMIPGVNIGKIPYLLHGTDDWAGGFARMNEGGRGELTYLPNGTTVVPHDISVRYAKESARANASGSQSIDLNGILEGMTIVVNASTNVDGAPLMEMASEYTIERIGDQQGSYMAVRGG